MPDHFLNRDTPPSPEQISAAIGKEVFPVWEDTKVYLESQFSDYEPELIYYSTQRGWGFRYRKGAQQLCVLFPARGAFTTLIALSPLEEERALEKVHFFNARIRELLNQISPLPQGRWLWIRMEDHTDFVGLKLLLEIKIQNNPGQERQMLM